MQSDETAHLLTVNRSRHAWHPVFAFPLCISLSFNGVECSSFICISFPVLENSGVSCGLFSRTAMSEFQLKAPYLTFVGALVPGLEPNAD